MLTYHTRCYQNNDIEKGFSFVVNANTIEEAAVESIQALKTIKFSNDPTWSGKIANPAGGDYEILKDGKWLVDSETGKKLSDLEKKSLNEKQ